MNRGDLCSIWANTLLLCLFAGNKEQLALVVMTMEGLCPDGDFVNRQPDTKPQGEEKGKQKVMRTFAKDCATLYGDSGPIICSAKSYGQSSARYQVSAFVMLTIGFQTDPIRMLTGHNKILVELCFISIRVIAVVGAATRVAEELDVEVGTIVGYQTRYEKAVSPKTCLVFMTKGILFRRLDAMLPLPFRRTPLVSGQAELVVQTTAKFTDSTLKIRTTTEVVLRLKGLGYKNITHFDFLDPHTLKTTCVLLMILRTCCRPARGRQHALHYPGWRVRFITRLNAMHCFMQIEQDLSSEEQEVEACCNEYFIDYRAATEALETHRRIEDIIEKDSLNRRGIPRNDINNLLYNKPLRKSLTAGVFTRAGICIEEGHYKVLRCNGGFLIDPDSPLVGMG
ncbi:pre-mrna-splicing factor atp-dependent rna helicase prp43 [Fusarium sporotrichioides]|uniref:Pre-mrna-splicing factor atp-dependent rna helicase prp43 n=1 Tax=Fusarium sporotrichioides TaxID=5514 RepID=A0A395SHM9_FUSSP|nr:pre-mrna-splicing factor atp-dependent rna helicase prp43 [Fusarium sporotrichioides]